MISFLILIIIYLAFVCLGLQDSLLGAAWPSMHGSLNVQLHYAGYIATIITSGRIFASIFIDRIVKRLGTGIVAIVSISITAVALFGISFSRVYILICLWSFLLGLGAGLIDAALNNHVALHYKAKYMSWLHCFWGIGASLGPVIVSFFLINKNSWNWGYRTIGIIQGCFVILLISTFSFWEKNKNSQNYKKIENLQTIPFKELIRIPGLKQVIAVFFCNVTLQATAGLWGTSFLVTEKGISAEIAAQFIFLFYIGITSGRFVSGFLTMKMNNRQIIRLSQFLIAFGILALILPFGNLLLLPAFFIIGFGCGPIFPSLLYETPKNFGADKSQAIMGIQMACGFIGGAVMPPLFGQITSFTGFFIYPFFIGAALIMEMIVLEILFIKVDKNRTNAAL